MQHRRATSVIHNQGFTIFNHRIHFFLIPHIKATLFRLEESFKNVTLPPKFNP
jgi:hypothetical protein